MRTKFGSSNDAEMIRRKTGKMAMTMAFFTPIFLLLFAIGTKCQNTSSMLNLDCANFDTNCQWLNANTPSASNSTLIWYRSSTVISSDQLQMTTGTTTSPNGSYAICSTIVVDSVNASQSATLVSAPVPCQNNNGSLIFNYWTSPFVMLNICCRTEGVMLNRSRDCQQGPFSQGPGPATIPLSPMKSPFRIMIEASNFVYSNGQLTGGFAIIDNVRYTGDYCMNITTTAAPASNSTAAANGTALAAAGNSTGIATATVPMPTNGGTNVGAASSSAGNSTAATNGTLGR